MLPAPGMFCATTVGIARDVLAEMARDQPAVEVVAAAGGVADRDGDGLAREERLGRLGVCAAARSASRRRSRARLQRLPGCAIVGFLPIVFRRSVASDCGAEFVRMLLAEIAAMSIGDALGMLQMHGVAGAVDHARRPSASGKSVVIGRAVRRRHHAVVLAPDHQRRHRRTVEPLDAVRGGRNRAA